MTILGCIADDFTGATDLAGRLYNSGVPVSLRIGVPDIDVPGDVRDIDTSAVEIIALKCRSIDPQQAVTQALQALKWLQNTGAKRFFWKYCSTFDSTDTGNIGGVAAALMQALGAEQTIYCPTFPENGRTVFMGHLFVHEKLLSDSPMQHHPITPMTNSNLQQVLKPQLPHGDTGLVSLLDIQGGVDTVKQKLADLLAIGKTHVIVDGICHADMHTLACACADMRLLTGGSVIAVPLSHAYQRQGLLPPAAQSAAAPAAAIGTGTLVLSGSCAAMTQRQVSAYKKHALSYHIDAIKLAKNGTQDIKGWLSAQDINADKIIYATADAETVAHAQSVLGDTVADIIETAMGDIATHALQLGIQRFVVAGGETSGAVTKALNITRMTISTEIDHGVPWTFCNSGDTPIALALKSGNFGNTAFFKQAFDTLNSILQQE